MKIEVTWKGVAVIFMITTIIFAFLLFKNIFSKDNSLPKTSFLEQYLKTENDLLTRQQDSLKVQIHNQKKSISQKDSLLIVLSTQKNKIKIVYYEKFKKIDAYSIRQLSNEFDSILSKNNIN
jgi:hypothetical protein